MAALDDLGLDRNLYKAPLEGQTWDASIIAATQDQNPIDPIATGNAATDVNNGSVQLNGETIAPGTIPADVLDVSNWGWTQTCLFASDSAVQVSWGSGNFVSANGISYAISAGNTGTMAGKTYIYLDLNVSSTSYQHTTTSGDSVGVGKVLVAVAQNAAVSATFNLNVATQIVGDNILANTIDASKITAGSITATQISVSYVYAGTINANQINAGTITGFTIVGSTLSTATTGQRVVLTTTLAQYYNSSNVQVGTIYGDTSGLTIQSNSGLLNLSSSIAPIITVIGASNYPVFDLANNRIVPNANGSLDLGAAGGAFGNIYAIGTIRYRAIDQPVQYHGYVSGTSITRTNDGALSVTNPSTGNYTVTHNLSSSNYTVQLTALRAVGTGAYIAKVAVLNTNSFGVVVFDDTGTSVNGDFMFLILQN